MIFPKRTRSSPSNSRSSSRNGWPSINGSVQPGSSRRTAMKLIFLKTFIYPGREMVGGSTSTVWSLPEPTSQRWRSLTKVDGGLLLFRRSARRETEPKNRRILNSSIKKTRRSFVTSRVSSSSKRFGRRLETLTHRLNEWRSSCGNSNRLKGPIPQRQAGGEFTPQYLSHSRSSRSLPSTKIFQALM